MLITDRFVVRTVRITVAVGCGLAVVASAVLITTGHAGFWVRDFLAVLALITIFFAAFAWVVIPRQPRNRAVWTMATSAFLGLFLTGPAVVALFSEVSPNDAFSVPPADLPASVAWTMVSTAFGYGLGFNFLMTFGFLLFPDGTLPSPRWRPVAWLAGASIVAVTLAYPLGFLPTNNGPPEEGTLINTAVSFHLLAAVLSLGALLGRFHRCRGATRQQFKWVAWGAATFVPVWVVTVFLGGTRHEYLVLVPFTVATAILVSSYGIAVGMYRPYDIDIVISRTFVYGTLAAFITGVYVAVVVGAGRLLGGGDDPNTALAIMATGGVAVAFQPLRRRLRRAADRMVYGRTATPHDVLSEFSRRVAATDDSVLAQVARSLVEGTAADGAAIWVARDGSLVKAAEWPEDADPSSEDLVACPIKRGGMELGRLTLSTSAGQHLPEEDLRLAEHVASGMGLALRNQLLSGTLQRRVDELRESRRRLVAARDDTRRRLERDLHDGAQQQLVALKVKLGVARALADQEGGAGTAALLGHLAEHADSAVDAVRDFARGVYPPMLEAEGLGAAIRAQARRSPISVAVEVSGIGRYTQEVEATVYFCVVELLQRIADRDEASEVRVRVGEADGALTFEVVDLDERARGDLALADRELVSVTDRLDAANGSFTIEPDTGRGRSIRGSIPFEATR